MRKPLIILLAVEFVLAGMIGQLGTLRRPKLDRAWLEWYQHPTSETREGFESQKRIAELERLGFSVVLFVVAAGVTIFIFSLSRGEQGAPGNSRHASQTSHL